jgi:hypothetical protein
MVEILDATGGDVVAVRMNAGTPAGYTEFYDLLAEKTDEHGTVHVYEEVPDRTLPTFLSHLHGIVPDLRHGPAFDIGRYAAVGDSRWFEALCYQWRVIAPAWPVSPDTMHHYGLADRDSALEWVETGAVDRRPRIQRVKRTSGVRRRLILSGRVASGFGRNIHLPSGDSPPPDIRSSLSDSTKGETRWDFGDSCGTPPASTAVWTGSTWISWSEKQPRVR